MQTKWRSILTSSEHIDKKLEELLRNLDSLEQAVKEQEHFEEPTEENSFKTELAEWILENKITRNASDGLLTLLKKNGHESLPKCTQTLLKTPRKIQISEKCGSDYLYLGI